MHEGPPLIPEWINKITCAKCKKKEYFSCNCPPKYNNKIRKMPQKKSSPSYNSVSKSTIQEHKQLQNKRRLNRFPNRKKRNDYLNNISMVIH